MIRRHITEADIDRSYRVLDLLTVLEHAARHLADAGEEAECIASAIAGTIEVAHIMAVDVHNSLEHAADRGRQP